MDFPGEATQLTHDIVNTIAWSILFNVTAILAQFRFSKGATYAHSVMGIIMLVLTYFSILWILIPFGFNLSVILIGGYVFAHGVLGLCMLGFVVIQVGGGIYTRLYNMDKKADVKRVLLMKRCHMCLGYLLGLVYKINIMWMWYSLEGTPAVTYFLIAWEVSCLTALFSIKFGIKKLEQINQPSFPHSIKEIEDLQEVKSITNEYLIFANHVYKAEILKTLHPGGTKVIEIIMNREVDRFLYGMYPAEIFP